VHLYLHIPFCHRICPYCAFYKHTPGKTDQQAFVQALLQESALYAGRHPGSALRSLYLGGGTPTALSEKHLEQLLRGLAQHWDFSQLEEFGIEANPRTVTANKASLLKDCGVNRVSVGVQAWDSATLQTLGRDHSAADAEEILQLLRSVGIRSINVDLMFSIPGQSVATWQSTLEQAIACKPDHISAYNLNYEEDTAFFERLQRGEYKEDGDRDATQFYLALDLLEAAGFQHYETSNYAKAGHRSVHNAGYWFGRDYLGLGPSATSTIGMQRWKNLGDTEQYIHALQDGILPQREAELLTPEQHHMERVALELRTDRGVSLDRLQAVPPSVLQSIQEEGLALAEAGQLILTHKGKPLVDAIAEALLL
jgi:oxygen-independent coproporphyrinogen III oxidase